MAKVFQMDVSGCFECPRLREKLSILSSSSYPVPFCRFNPNNDLHEDHPRVIKWYDSDMDDETAKAQLVKMERYILEAEGLRPLFDEVSGESEPESIPDWCPLPEAEG